MLLILGLPLGIAPILWPSGKASKISPEEAKAILADVIKLADQLRGYGRAPRGYGYSRPGYYPAPRVEKAEGESEDDGEKVEKAGAVLSATNKKKVKAALEALQALIAAAEKADKEDNKEPVKKSEREVELEQRIADLEERLEDREDYRYRFLLGYAEYYSGLPKYGLPNLKLAAEQAPPQSGMARLYDLLTGGIPSYLKQPSGESR